MNILIFTTHFNAGGITSYILSLTRGFVKKGHCIYVASSGGNMIEELKSSGGRHVDLDINTKSELSPKVYRAVNKLQSFIRENAIDVVHSQTRVTQVVGTMLKHFIKIPHVATCHGFFKARISRKIFPCWGDATIAISPQVVEHLKNDLCVSKEKIFLIPHGVEIKECAVGIQQKEEKRKELNLKKGVILGIVARLSDVKGIDVAIKAMKKVIESNPEANLLIVGEGKEGDALLKLVDELGLEKNVSFLPIINDLDNILPFLDIFVMPSRQEGLGLSVMEAQAVGLPVVASKIGGLMSLIQDGETGLLVPTENPDALAAALVMLINNMEKAKELGAAGKAFIKKNFSPEKMIDKTLEIYQGVLK
ncbi:MAG: glycosyltransferase family 4 protein [Candidatus Aceula meridiana]|nr:glycosyltransferase family 4 protein [Candidatus Aceula meridiana]